MADAHDHAHKASERQIFRAMLLTGAFIVVEAVGGWFAGSLALLADAGHMLADTLALWLAWMAFRISRRPSDPRRSYGYHRFQVLAAFVNGIGLLAIVAWIVYEAARRLAEPVAVTGDIMLAVAVVGIVVNLIAFAMLRRGDSDNLNLKGAALHVMGDLLGSVATVAAAIVILATGWTPIDPLLSLCVALLILGGAWGLLRKSVHILLEGTPDWLDTKRLGRELADAVPAVRDIHHVHAWSLTSQHPLLTLHASIDPAADFAATLDAVKAFLESEYGIAHSTVQLEPEECADEP